MNKNIYANSDEKFVKATVLFSSEDKIYYDEACTEEVTLEDALNLFKKGLMLVSVDGGFKRPTGITVTEEGYEISYGGNGGGSGAEEFVVTFIKVEGTDAWISNKTFVEISDAIESGKNVIGSFLPEAEGSESFLLSLAARDNSMAYAFCGLVVGESLEAHAFAVLASDEVAHLKGTFLPPIDDDDDNKVLTVKENSANWESLPTE